jgi:hypothetical protein
MVEQITNSNSEFLKLVIDEQQRLDECAPRMTLPDMLKEILDRQPFRRGDLMPLIAVSTPGKSDRSWMVNNFLYGKAPTAMWVDDPVFKFTPVEGMQEEFPIRCPRLKTRLVRAIEFGDQRQPFDPTPRDKLTGFSNRGFAFLGGWLDHISRTMNYNDMVKEPAMLVWRTPKQAREGWCVEVYRVALVLDVLDHVQIDGLTDHELKQKIMKGEVSMSVPSKTGTFTLSYQGLGGVTDKRRR